MKSLTSIRRSGLVLVVVLATGMSRAQDAPEASPTASATPEAPAASPSPTPGRSKRATLENELAMYSPFESPWAEIKANHALESHLFNLMRAEVRLWGLQDQLAAQNSPSHDDASEVSRIVHEQILNEAAEALPILQKTPNKAFAQLLVHQLEAYPYEWQEEGSEGLLPSLHKLVDPPADKPTPAEGGRRHRRRGGIQTDR